MALQTFEKWAIDFVGPINPPGKHTGARYIITAMPKPEQLKTVVQLQLCILYLMK
jgi:hypothetical protein